MRHKRAGWLASVGAAITIVAVVTTSTPGQADPAVASATLVDINNNKVGEARFTPMGDGSVKGRITVTIDTNVVAPTSEFHGFHIHANDDDDNADGNTNDGCVTFDQTSTPASNLWFTEVDGHWNPTAQTHGNHVGDLPSLIRQRDGDASIEFVIDKLTAAGIPGKALVVHFAADDFGKHPTVGTSATTGNAGFRYACGLIVPTARG
jgi:superoxide dismutase, Cu-Zn family